VLARALVFRPAVPVCNSRSHAQGECRGTGVQPG
jgi:hypothetical protein